MSTANKGEQDVHARIEEALERGESALAHAGIEDAQGEAVCLFCFAAGISKSELLLRQGKVGQLSEKMYTGNTIQLSHGDLNENPYNTSLGASTFSDLILRWMREL